MTTDQIIEAVARRAASDSAFRNRALADADAVVAEEADRIGATAPAPGSVSFVAAGEADRSAGTGARVITLSGAEDDSVEMEDADLEQVAGGCQEGCSNDYSNYSGPFPKFEIQIELPNR